MRQILQDTADKLVDPDPDPQLGNRFGSYDANGYSQWFGYGKVNAARAVKLARDRLPTPLIPNQWVNLQNTTAVAIPDFNLRGITSLIQARETQPLRDLRITVEVTHEYLGDLSIQLQPPQGNAILLQSRTLGQATQLQYTYSLQTTPLLRSLLNQSPRGTWQLKITDNAPGHTGTLRRWQLSLGL
ncbi:proprotein convertase P-domain-containing protein [Leptolyngbya sp. PL-A3]